MSRPRKDGTPARPPNKRMLTELYLQKVPTPKHGYMVWDTKQSNLALLIRPTGHMSFKCIYSRGGRSRWYDLGKVKAIGLANARKLARKIMVEVADGKDPQADRRAQRTAGSFAELCSRYVDVYAKKKNRSWQQSKALVGKHLIPRLGKLPAAGITRDDIERVTSRIEAPVVANQVLAAASAIFSWALGKRVGGITINPCVGIDRNEVKSRERVLSDNELPLFWAAFDKAGLAGAALKLVLLTGQRPGEVAHMRREHIDAGWWTMPGEPVSELGWPGTKNKQTHRVWLPKPVVALLAELKGEGFMLTRHRGKPIALDAVMRKICRDLKIDDKVTPHDLRRTHGTMITGLGFGRDAMNRIQNHKEGGITDVYDRHKYGPENTHVMEAVAAKIMALAEGRADTAQVIEFASPRK
jgi:integrase